jgi:hypothetical protein
MANNELNKGTKRKGGKNHADKKCIRFTVHGLAQSVYGLSVFVKLVVHLLVVFNILCHASVSKVYRGKSGSVSQSLRMGTTKTARRKGLGYASAVPTPGALLPV